jgi:hypothetical protein
MLHFWAGSFCRCSSIIAVEHKDNPELYFPSAVVGASEMLSEYVKTWETISRTSHGYALSIGIV